MEVMEIQQLSPSVKGYTLAVKNTNLKFQPGQWYVRIQCMIMNIQCIYVQLCQQLSLTPQDHIQLFNVEGWVWPGDKAISRCSVMLIE